MHEITKLAVDLYKGQVTEFSKEKTMEVLRQELIELNGGSDKITPKSFRKYPILFEVLEQALDILIVDGLEAQFDEFVETVVLDWGDTKVFTLQEHRLFDVAIVSDGNGDIRRDRLDVGEFTVKTQTLAVGIYEELHRLLAGRVDWAKMVDNVAKSYNNKIKTEIYNALYNSFDKLSATYGVTGVFAESKLRDLIAHVEAGTGMEALILGTKQSLGQITNATMSESMKETKGKLGYIGNFEGTDMIEIKQAHKAGTQVFAIDNNFLIVTPKSPDKLVKLVLEGDSLIQETVENTRKDMQKDYVFIKKAGFAVISTSKYGIYRLG
jgi:hypothetical protein